jgi:hypothetical protein
VECFSWCCVSIFAMPVDYYLSFQIVSSWCAYSVTSWVPLKGSNMWCWYQISRVCKTLGLTDTRGPRACHNKLFFTLTEHHALFGQIHTYLQELICVWMCFIVAKCSIIIAHIIFGCSAWNLVPFIMRLFFFFR